MTVWRNKGQIDVPEVLQSRKRYETTKSCICSGVHVNDKVCETEVCGMEGVGGVLSWKLNQIQQRSSNTVFIVQQSIAARKPL